MKKEWQSGNSVELLINGEEFFGQVFSCIRKAKQEIIIETFILREDSVGNQLQKLLIEAARRGVRVELTVDDYGTWDLSHEFVDPLVNSGVKLHIFDPQPKLLGVRLNIFRRLHRKLAVIDGEVAFIGGINYSDDHLTDYGEKAKQDYALALRGPIVADVHKVCMLLLLRGSSRRDRRTYLRNIKQVPPDPHGHTPVLLVERDNRWHKNDIEKQYLHAIRTAKTRLVIANAYFFPPFFFLRALRQAALRGVKVTLIMQGLPDMPWVSTLTRLLYNYLLHSRVEVYEYCQRSFHGKIAIMDDEWLTVGSSNLDPLSFSLNLEANVIVRDPAITKQLSEHLTGLIKAHCKKVSMEIAQHGYWWRIPLIFLSFHFLRRFPSIAGWLPAHAPVLKLLRPRKTDTWKQTEKIHRDNTSEKKDIDTYDKESLS